MAILDVNIVTVGMPKIMSHFGVDITDVEWVMIAYTITYSIVILPMSFIRRKYGIKYPFMFSILLFTIGSALCGISPSFTDLIIFRIIQAIPKEAPICNVAGIRLEASGISSFLTEFNAALITGALSRPIPIPLIT